MRHDCSTCNYMLLSETDEPCVRCKRTVSDLDPEYNTRPDLWSDAKVFQPTNIYCEGKRQAFVDGILMDDKNDPVNHPSHYTKGKIEVADFIADQKLNFDRGNAVKYVCRAGSKDPEKEIQDLEKAIWYINHEIKILKGDIENGTEKENT